MATVEKSIEVEVPVTTAYNQWTQFELFPRFMDGVEAVEQRDDTHLHWRARVAGKEKEWDAEITEQTPDQRIAWRSTDGAPNAGVVTFHKLNDSTTKVMLQVDAEPEGLMEKAGDVAGVLDRRVEGDLERFKDFVEHRGAETGAWRGTVDR
ncbi:MAG: SRPBCC family protein [Candidatus Dormibacteria bacterium]